MSVTKNFFYSSIITVSGYLFPLLTYPYISRVLGVNNIGICNFVDSIINYFSYISMMGVATVGVRAVAAAKNGESELNKTFSAIFVINAFLTLLALVILIACMLFVPSLQPYKKLLLVGVIKLVGLFVMIDWFYKGIEDFKYITQRTLVVKTLYVIAVFLFIKKADDYPLYYLLSCLMVGVNAVINFVHARRYVKIRTTCLEIKNHIKPILVIGFYMIINTMYTTFNVVFLGFAAGTTQVGYYTTSHKLYIILFSFFSAFSGVMLPRLSSIISEGDIDKFKSMIGKAVDALLLFTIPIVLVAFVFNIDIIDLFSGKGYEGAYLPTKIMMPLIFIIGYEQILVLQILMPLKKDNLIIRNSVVGAIIGIVLNIILVPTLGAVGSSIVWLCAEICVLSVAQYSVWNLLKISFPIKKIVVVLIAYLPAVICCVAMKNLDIYPIVRLIGAGLFVGLYTVLIQTFIVKNPMYFELLKKAKLYRGK